MNAGPAPGQVRVTTPEGWVTAAAEAMEEALSAALQAREGPIYVGLSGGSTPEPVYRALSEQARGARAKEERALSGLVPEEPARVPQPRAAKPPEGPRWVEWSRVVILPADERFVPEEDPESNHAMIRNALLPVVDEGLRMPFFGRQEGRSLTATAGALAEALPGHLDLLVLGIGEDGHTASLFPGDLRAELSSGRRTLTVRDSPKPPLERVSITPAVIESARVVLLLARGAGKAEAVRRALRGAWDPVGTPGQWARPGSWILDPGAASAL